LSNFKHRVAYVGAADRQYLEIKPYIVNKTLKLSVSGVIVPQLKNDVAKLFEIGAKLAHEEKLQLVLNFAMCGGVAVNDVKTIFEPTAQVCKNDNVRALALLDSSVSVMQPALERLQSLAKDWKNFDVINMNAQPTASTSVSE
jgi:hypothetical protein